MFFLTLRPEPRSEKSTFNRTAGESPKIILLSRRRLESRTGFQLDSIREMPRNYLLNLFELCSQLLKVQRQSASDSKAEPQSAKTV